MANKPLRPGPIGVVDQAGPFIILELAIVTKWQTNRKLSPVKCGVIHIDSIGLVQPELYLDQYHHGDLPIIVLMRLNISCVGHPP